MVMLNKAGLSCGTASQNAPCHHGPYRICGLEGLRANSPWRINTHAVDMDLSRFGLRAGENHLAVPPGRMNSTPWAEIEAGYITGLAARECRKAEQDRRRVVAGGSAEVRRVLA